MEEKSLRSRFSKDEFWHDWIQAKPPFTTVILAEPIYLGAHESNTSAIREATGTNPSHFSSAGAGKLAVVGLDTAMLPVESVMCCWSDAADFCSLLSKREQHRPFYSGAGKTETIGREPDIALPRNPSGRLPVAPELHQVLGGKSSGGTTSGSLVRSKRRWPHARRSGIVGKSVWPL